MSAGSRDEAFNYRRRRRMLKQFPCCIWCGVRFRGPGHATLEHLVPRAFGGSSALENLALSCPTCNRKRGVWYRKHAGHLIAQVEAFAKRAVQRAIDRALS